MSRSSEAAETFSESCGIKSHADCPPQVGVARLPSLQRKSIPKESLRALAIDVSGWFKAADSKDIPQGTMKGVDIEGTKILLTHGASGIRAFEDRCGHMSAPMSIGTFKSGVIKCALHAAVFDAETGAVRGQPQMHMGGNAQLPPEMVEAMMKMGQIMAQIRCEPLRPFPVAVESSAVMVYV